MDDVGRAELGEKPIDRAAVSRSSPSTSESPVAVGQRPAMAGREIVDHQDFVPLRQLALDQVRAEAAGPAGNQNAHQLVSAYGRGLDLAPRFLEVGVAADHAVFSPALDRQPGDLVERREFDVAEIREGADGSSRMDGASSGPSGLISGSG